MGVTRFAYSPLQVTVRHPRITDVAQSGVSRSANRPATAGRDSTEHRRRLPISASLPGDGPAQPAEAGFPRIPRPRAPLSESIRRILPRPERPIEIDLDEACFALAEVAVRTCADGSWQEHACFLLGSASGRWQVIPFSHPVVGDLIGRLRLLPGFDDNQLLDLIGSKQTEIVVLWRDPALARTR
jgi:hypothetical protein